MEDINRTISVVSLCDPMDCDPPGSSVLEILQARILEWVTVPSSRGSSPPRDRFYDPTCRIFRDFCTGGGFFTAEPPGKPSGTSTHMKRQKVSKWITNQPKYCLP